MKPTLFQLLLIALTIVIATGQTRNDQYCPDQSFWNSQACMPCSENCKTCTSYLGTCSTSQACEKGQVFNSIDEKCVPCPDGCAECTLEGTNGYKCQECESGYEEIEDICIQINPDDLETDNLGRYKLYSSSSINFSGLTTPCAKLDDDTARCKECSEGSFLNEFQKCEKCLDNCAKCNARGTCQECNANSTWRANANPNNQSNNGTGAGGCVLCQNEKICTTCQAGYYLDTGTCKLCFNNTDATQSICLACNTGKNSKCDTCANNYLNVNGNCQKCSEQITSCQSCVLVGNVISCTICNNGFYLSKDRQSGVGTCIACSTVSDPQNALLCNKDDKVNSDNVTVTQCAYASTLTLSALTSTNYFTIPTSSGKVACVQNTNACYKMVDNTGKCSDCVAGYYLKSDTKVCTRCNIAITNCDTCTNDPLCSTCAPGYILSSDKKSCIACPAYCDTCALGTTANTAICTKCVDQYALATDKSKCNQCTANCLECDATGKCLKCSTGYRNDGTTCIKCSVNYCAECASDAAKCTKCIPSMFLYTDPSNVQNCYVCPPGCLDCSSSNNQLGGQKCNSCINGYFKQGDGCTFGVDYCAKYNEDGSCQQCQYGMRESGGRCFRCVGMVGGYVCGENAGTSSCFSQIYQNLLMTFIASMILILH